MNKSLFDAYDSILDLFGDKVGVVAEIVEKLGNAIAAPEGFFDYSDVI